MPKKKPDAAEPPVTAEVAQARDPDDPIAMVRTDMERLGGQTKHVLAQVPLSVFLNEDVARVRILQGMYLPAEVAGDAVAVLHDGAYAPEYRPDDFPAHAAPVHHPDSASRILFLTGLLHWSVDGRMVENQKSVSQQLFGLFGRVFRRQAGRQAHSELAENNDMFDQQGGSY